MAKKPNFDFEKREREKAKAAKLAEKARAKSERKEAGTVAETHDGAPDDQTR